MTATKYQKQGRAVSLAQQWTASRALDHLEGRLSFDDLTPASQRMVREMHPDAFRRMAETDVTRLPNYGKPRFEPGSRAYKKWKKRKQRNGEWVSYTQPKVIPIKQWRRKFRHK